MYEYVQYMQQSYFGHTQQKDDSCEHHWMCIEDLLEEVCSVYTISGRISTHSYLHPLLHNTSEIYFCYELTENIISMDTLAALQRDNGDRFQLYTPPVFSKATHWAHG